jgi:rhodanese-related sulfurtransferase
MKNLRKLFFRGVLQTIAIIAVGAVIGLSANSLRADRLMLAKNDNQQAKQTSGQAVQNQNAITDITVWEAFKAFRSGKTLFIDARKDYDFNAGHIPNAVNIYPGGKSRLRATEPKGKSEPIITYCLSADCGLAEELAKELASQGFTNVKVMKDGWEAWSASGYPTESGR